MIECHVCGYKWNVKYMIAKGITRCRRCNAELDVASVLLADIGGVPAIKDLKQRMEATRRN